MTKKANVEKYTAVIEGSNAVHEQYKKYVDTYVHRANKELYAMLAELLRYAEGVLERSDKDAAILAMRKVLKEKYAIKTTAKTGDLGVIVRMVLRSAHRKTIFTYKQVLQLALDNNVGADGLADFIVQHEGIEKLRTATAQSESRKLYEQKVCDEQILASYYLLACEEKRKLVSFAVNDDVYTRSCDARNNDGIVFAACSVGATGMHVLDFVEVDKELNSILLRKVYKDAFNRARFDKEREGLARRAYELNEMQASMFMGQIYSGGKEVVNCAANDDNVCKKVTDGHVA